MYMREANHVRGETLRPPIGVNRWFQSQQFHVLGSPRDRDHGYAFPLSAFVAFSGHGPRTQRRGDLEFPCRELWSSDVPLQTRLLSPKSQAEFESAARP